MGRHSRRTGFRYFRMIDGKAKYYRKPWTETLVTALVECWPHIGTHLTAVRLGLTKKQVKAKVDKLKLQLLPKAQRLCITCNSKPQDNRSYSCRSCRLSKRQHHRRDPARPLEAWVLEVIRTMKYRSRRRHSEECDLTVEYMCDLWVQQNSSCHYCSRQLASPNYDRKRSRDTASVDRVDAAYGYRINNVVWACWGCNWMKSNQTAEEFIAHCTAIAMKHRANQDL